MKKKKIVYSTSYDKNQRPYYICTDNVNSRMRISQITSFKSINEIMQDKELTKALITEDFFETNYMKKIKKEAISYPTNKELEK